MKRIFTIINLLAILVVSLAGCASTNETLSENANAARLIAAKAIARTAGKLVAANNPELGASVTVAYAAIKKLEGDEFRSEFITRLREFLRSEGVEGDVELAALAADLLEAYGYDIETTPIDSELLSKIDTEAIKAVVNAFIEGMSFAATA